MSLEQERLNTNDLQIRRFSSIFNRIAMLERSYSFSLELVLGIVFQFLSFGNAFAYPCFLNYLIHNAISKKMFFYNHGFVNKPLSMTKETEGVLHHKEQCSSQTKSELWFVCVTRRGNKP